MISTSLSLLLSQEGFSCIRLFSPCAIFAAKSDANWSFAVGHFERTGAGVSLRLILLVVHDFSCGCVQAGVIRQPRTQRMLGSWKKLRAAFWQFQQRCILIGRPDHFLPGAQETHQEQRSQDRKGHGSSDRLLCQCAAQGDAHFLKVHFPAIGKNGNHCEFKRLIQGFCSRSPSADPPSSNATTSNRCDGLEVSCTKKESESIRASDLGNASS